MQEFDRRRYEMLTRVRDFGATYGPLFPESTMAPRAFVAIANAVGEIKQRDVAESSASVAARAPRKIQARRALRERLQLVARTAGVLPGKDAGFRAHFEISESGTDTRLLANARQCVERASECATQFVSYGLPPTFISELNTLIDTLETAVRDRGLSRDQLVAARTGIREALTGAFTAVAELDVMVANHLTSNPVVREVWKRSRKVEYPWKRKRATPEATATTEAATAPVPASDSATATV